MNLFGKLKGIVAMSVIALGMQAQTAEDFVPYKHIDLRLPSVPIIINNPMFSLWSNYDHLNDGAITHWSTREKAIDGILRVDGISYRFMGADKKNILNPIAGLTVDGDMWSGRVNYQKQNNTNWAAADFDDSSWAVEEAAWGTKGEYPNVKHEWKATNSDIYVRRTVNLTAEDLEKELWVVFSHDDVFEMYINGVKAASTGETWIQGEERKLSAEVKRALKVGENVLAAHCHNTNGGAYIDFGLYENVFQDPGTVQKAVQNSVDVMATGSYYNFTCGPVTLDVLFTSPMLIDDMDMISTPINYVSYQVKATDGAEHNVQFYLSTSAQLTVHDMGQATISEITTENGINYLKAGSVDQNYCQRTGDMVCIDWGYLYIPAINGSIAMASQADTENSFINTGKLPASLPGKVTSTGRSNMPLLAFMNDLGNTREARNFMMIGYDEVWDMEYMHKLYKAYYARNGKTIFQAFEEYRDNYANTMARCRALDKMIYDDALAAGNVKYAEQLVANYRLVMGAHKLFQDDNGNALYFSKENKSGGFVNTVDLTYPESPLYLLYNPELQKGMMLSILDYGKSSARRDKPYAAHDLGIYPRANGMVYGDSMPLEESANMILLAYAVTKATGSGEWLKPYTGILSSWANYCKQNGQNPGNQLCTDDFKGPSEQNTNLSVKAIMAVKAYSELLPLINGSSRTAKTFADAARNMALIWEADARDGDHYRMEFHKSGTWSQKYNLLWDDMYGWELFPEEVVDREIAFYLKKQQKYGLPLDSRDLQTKSDWIFWTASLARDLDTFLKFSDRHWDYINETHSRIPLSDYYMSNNGNTCNFSGRSVIAGLWAKILKDRYTPAPPAEKTWEPKGNHIKTRWAADVDPENTLPEYPRPQMQRRDWMNLNGLWDYAITSGRVIPDDEEYAGQILVPFCIESSLSGVNSPLEPGKRLWYRRDVTIPADWAGKRVILNFGAVDYQATVYVNGITSKNQLGTHIGGHSSFSYDITDYIEDGKATIYVQVIDSTDENAQPVGKQRRYPNGNGDIFYTSTSGIWQPVWLEPVEESHINKVNITPDIDNKTLSFDILGTMAEGFSGNLRVTVYEDGAEVGQQTVTAAQRSLVTINIPNVRYWSPASPYLYDVAVDLIADGKTVDHIDSYAAMRKISYRKTSDGYFRMQLNNQDLFQFGPLDQGYWPDGIMTAPTDEALVYDIEKTKEWGFNMIRKHMKVEPDRWYYHCDRLGLLVWQDMPSTFRTDEGWVVDRYYDEHNCTQSATLEKNFKAEWAEIIGQLYSHPCIVTWTPFNERWGQFKTNEIVAYTQSLDKTRLVNPASGGNHYHCGEGTFVDMHTYGQPITVFENIYDPNRPLVLGEYGGLGRNISGHRWFERNSQTYNTYGSVKAITDAYVTLAGQIENIAKGYVSGDKKINFCAGVYTQTTDVETEVNGIMTYDREQIKFDEARLIEANKKLTDVFGEFNGVENVTADRTAADGPCTYYNLQGIPVAEPAEGINIVRRADGTAVKAVF